MTKGGSNSAFASRLKVLMALRYIFVYAETISAHHKKLNINIYSKIKILGHL